MVVDPSRCPRSHGTVYDTQSYNLINPGSGDPSEPQPHWASVILFLADAVLLRTWQSCARPWAAPHRTTGSGPHRHTHVHAPGCGALLAHLTRASAAILVSMSGPW